MLASNMLGPVGQKLIDFSASSFFSALSSWMAQGAAWILTEIGSLLSKTSSTSLAEPYVKHQLSVMGVVAFSLSLPLTLLAIIKSTITHDFSSLVKLLAIKIPIAFCLTSVIVGAIEIIEKITDSLCNFILAQSGSSTTVLLTKMARFSIVLSSSQIPGLIQFFICLFIVISGFTLWFELVLRSAAITISIVFLPLALVGILFSLTSHWIKKLSEILLTLILSKLVIVTVLTLALSELSYSTQHLTIADFFTGLCTLILACLAPFALLKIVALTDPYLVASVETAGLALKQKATSFARLTTNLASQGISTDYPNMPTSDTNLQQAHLNSAVPTYEEVLAHFNQIGSNTSKTYKKQYSFDIEPESHSK
jgi:hypothetical protein